MYTYRKVTDDIYWIGGNDKRLHLFENIFPIERGVSYNTYLLDDGEVTVAIDTVDWAACRTYLQQMEALLDGRKLDYLLIHHLEPDHGASIEEVVLRYPDVKIVCSEQGFDMMRQFQYKIKDENLEVVKEGDTKKFGKHTFAFLEAPMIHWPEVIVSLDLTSGCLFSADAFGSFGALDGKLFNDEVNFDRDWLDDARRYYTNIVGKYGPFTQDLLKKAAPLLDKVKFICPLHGPVWRNDFGYFIDKYDKWSKYEPEEEGVVIAYASMYGHTEYAAQCLASELCEKGMTNVVMHDVSNTDVSFIISDIFKYSHIVLASVTYNLQIYPKMKDLLHDMQALNVQNRTVGIMENGTWACTVGDLMEEYINEELKLVDVLGDRVTMNSSLSIASKGDMDSLADGIIQSMKDIRELKAKKNA